MDDRTATSKAILISQVVIPYLHNLGYLYLDREVSVPVGSGSRRAQADLVAYQDTEKTRPAIVVEVKRSLTGDISLLDPPVQQLFAVAVAFGDAVRYCLLTDGTNHFWFEKSLHGRSLEPLNAPPRSTDFSEQFARLQHSLVALTDPDQFVRLLQTIIDALRQEGAIYDLRMATDINRILIAKLFDEKHLRPGSTGNFTSQYPEALTAQRIHDLYDEAIAEISGAHYVEPSWTLSIRALDTAVRILQPYALSTVTASVRSYYFWQAFADLIKADSGEFTTAVPLAELLTSLVRPKLTERVIDPACGTGLLLVAALAHIKAQSASDDIPASRVAHAVSAFKQNLVGIERNSAIAELARTNLVLNDVSPDQIVEADGLDRRSRPLDKVAPGSFDVVVLDPPIGSMSHDHYRYLQDGNSYYNLRGPRPNVALLFLERSLELLQPGGRVATLIPDAILSSPSYSDARGWLLTHTIVRALISLPPETFSSVGHSRKASALLLEKRGAQDTTDGPTLVVDVRSVGYDRFGVTSGDNDLSRLLDILRVSNDLEYLIAALAAAEVHSWTVEPNRLRVQRFDVAELDPASENAISKLRYGRFPTARLREVVDIISGQNTKQYVEAGPETASVIQAGAVRDLTLHLSSLPQISSESYERAQRAWIHPNDVLVTTTGQYLGRAAVIETAIPPAVASAAVTILRPKRDVNIDPWYLAILLNSDLCRRQIDQRKAAATGQPYIRRADLGEIVLSIPPFDIQMDIANRVRAMLTEAESLVQRADALQRDAREVIAVELLGAANE